MAACRLPIIWFVLPNRTPRHVVASILVAAPLVVGVGLLSALNAGGRTLQPATGSTVESAAAPLVVAERFAPNQAITVDAAVAGPVRTEYVALSPSRVLDTRDGTGVTSGALGPGASLSFTVGGVGSVPADASAVVLNVTAVGASEQTFLTVWPAGSDRPFASSLNPTPGFTMPNAVTATIGSGGQVSIYNEAGSVHVVADVSGYYAPVRSALSATSTTDAVASFAGPGAVNSSTVTVFTLDGVAAGTWDVTYSLAAEVLAWSGESVTPSCWLVLPDTTTTAYGHATAASGAGGAVAALDTITVQAQVAVPSAGTVQVRCRSERSSGSSGGDTTFIPDDGMVRFTRV